MASNVEKVVESRGISTLCWTSKAKTNCTVKLSDNGKLRLIRGKTILYGITTHATWISLIKMQSHEDLFDKSCHKNDPVKLLGILYCHFIGSDKSRSRY